MVTENSALARALERIEKVWKRGSIYTLVALLEAMSEERPDFAELVIEASGLHQGKNPYPHPSELAALVMPIVHEAAAHSDWMLRAKSAWALGHFRSWRALEDGDVDLLGRLLVDESAAVASEAARALRHWKDADMSAHLEALEHAANHDEQRVHRFAARTLTEQRIRAGLEEPLSLHPSHPRRLDLTVEVFPRRVLSPSEAPWKSQERPFHNVAGCGHCGGTNWHYSFIFDHSDNTRRHGEAETFCRDCGTFTLFDWDR